MSGTTVISVVGPDISTVYRPHQVINPAFALAATSSVRRSRGVHWWVTRTPIGPGSLAFRMAEGAVRVDAWGDGADWMVSHLPRLLGADDNVEGFEPRHRVVARMADRFLSIRIGATGRWFEAVASTVIGQRVTTADAAHSRNRLARRFGGPIPGPAPLGVFPAADQLLRIADHEFHRLGIERSRARNMRVAAKYADRIEALHHEAGPEAEAWLNQLPGIGPWTSGLARSEAGGDADAVPIGDLHLPRIVVFALTGKKNGTDAEMLEALEPYAGHRQRVVRMLAMGGAGEASHRALPFRSDISQI